MLAALEQLVVPIRRGPSGIVKEHIKVLEAPCCVEPSYYAGTVSAGYQRLQSSQRTVRVVQMLARLRPRLELEVSGRSFSKRTMQRGPSCTNILSVLGRPNFGANAVHRKRLVG